jgi:hypothetical protein
LTLPVTPQQIYFLHKILSPLVGNTNSFAKNSEHFIKLIQDISLQNEDYLVSFDIVRIFTSVPVEKVLQVIRNRLNTDPSFPECSPLQIEDIMESLDICLTTSYFQFEDKFYQQKGNMSMGNILTPLVNNVFMKHFEDIPLDTADHKPAKWIRYVNDTFMVWPHGPARLQQFFHHLKNIRPTIKFTVKAEANDTLHNIVFLHPVALVYHFTHSLPSLMQLCLQFR